VVGAGREAGDVLEDLRLRQGNGDASSGTARYLPPMRDLITREFDAPALVYKA